MTEHKHTALMAEYAKDAAEMDKPWLMWEFRAENISCEFLNCQGEPSWFDYNEYRRKLPRTLTISEEAENWVSLYSDPEREDIAAELLNAFHEGAKTGALMTHEQYKRVLKDMLPFVANNRKQKDRDVAVRQLLYVLAQLGVPA